MDTKKIMVEVEISPRCSAKESGGCQCELAAGPKPDKHACTAALKRWLNARYGKEFSVNSSPEEDGR